MDIEGFMRGYKAAWEGRDDELLLTLFAPDAAYHNTPFAVQRGREAIRAYWQRVKLQRDVRLVYDILQARADGGIAHWRTTYQVASEEMFRMWAASAGTNLIARKEGDPLPRLVLDGIAAVTLAPDGLCSELRLWWHSVADVPDGVAPPAR